MQLIPLIDLFIFPPDLQPECGEFSDKHHLAKSNMIMSISNTLLSCNSCDMPGFPSTDSINSWFVPQTQGLNQLNTTTISSSDSNTMPPVTLSSNMCNLKNVYESEEQKFTATAGLRNVLKDTFDCRFKNVS